MSRTTDGQLPAMTRSAGRATSPSPVPSPQDHPQHGPRTRPSAGLATTAAAPLGRSSLSSTVSMVAGLNHPSASLLTDGRSSFRTVRHGGGIGRVRAAVPRTPRRRRRRCRSRRPPACDGRSQQHRGTAASRSPCPRPGARRTARRPVGWACARLGPAASLRRWPGEQCLAVTERLLLQ